jgi:predicted metal-dependent enzyme (double-stranded beta helix superfamily)
MLRGAEIAQPYSVGNASPRPVGPPERLEPGMLCAVSPAIGDVHQVRNAFEDRVSISIHLYGADIGKLERHVFDAATGQVKTFVSGYSNRLEWTP